MNSDVMITTVPTAAQKLPFTNSTWVSPMARRNSPRST